MKKFTTIALALVLGGAAFSASAAETLPQPSISPESGTKMSYVDETCLKWDVGITEVDEVDCVAYVSYGVEELGTVDLNLESEWIEQPDGTYVEGPAKTIYINWGGFTYNSDYTTKTGEYTITIKPGTIANADDPEMVNAEIVINYTVLGYKGNETIDPEPGYGKMFSPASLSAVTITWDNTPFISYDSDVMITCVSADRQEGDDEFGPGIMPGLSLLNSPVENGVLNPELIQVNLQEGTIVLDLSELSEGSWNIEIPQGFASFDQYTVTGGVTINYTIFNGLSSATVLSPEKDIVSMPGNVELTWNYETVTLNPEAVITVEYYGEDGLESPEVPASAIHLISVGEGGGNDPSEQADSNSGNLMIIQLSEMLDGVTGYVTVKIPEGIVENAEGLVNPEQTIDFQIIPAADTQATFVVDDNLILVTWDGYYVSWPSDEYPIYVESAEGDKTNLSVYEEIYFIENPANYFQDLGYEIDLSSLDLADGEYTLVIPGESIQLENSETGAINMNLGETFEFVVEEGEIKDASTSVSKIENVKAVEGVYNLQGMKVGNDINGLSKGIYIINGKKVILK